MIGVIKNSGIPSLTVAGRVFTDLANLIVLWGGASGTGAGYCTPHLANVASGYQVDPGKTFYALAMRVDIRTAGLLYFGYCDNDLGIATNNAPTSPVIAGSAANACRTGLVLQSGAVNSQFETDWTGFTIPTGKYLYTYNDNASFVGSYKIYGYLV